MVSQTVHWLAAVNAAFATQTIKTCKFSSVAQAISKKLRAPNFPKLVSCRENEGCYCDRLLGDLRAGVSSAARSRAHVGSAPAEH